MCGIAGAINYKKDAEGISLSLNQSIIHRGPDDQSVYIDKNNNICLTMTRLSIIGLTEGRQPKISDDEKVIVFFNGEIFNYKELNKIFFKNKNFKSDTEIILNMYLLFDLSMLKHLNGMFAISIYDKRKNKLFLIRDRFGIKPIYYYKKNKHFMYSSEINTIKNLNNNLDINEESISDYLSLGVTGKKNTIYKNVNKLGAGEVAIYDLNHNSLKIKKWYFFKLRNNKIKSYNEAIEFTKEKITQSVDLWSTSDVPICFLLSGGFDSSLLSSIYNSSNSGKINTFSLGFSDKKYDEWNELEVSNSLAKKINSNHNNIIINVNNLLDELDEMVLSLGEPYGGGLPSWYIFKEISKKTKVAISGTGGDELFGNYNRYYNMKNIYGSNSITFNKKILEEGYCFNKHYNANDNWKSRYLNFNFKKRNIVNDYYSKLNKFNFKSLQKKIGYLDIETQLCDEFLYITDKFSMAHSLEVRTPYLDHELVESIYSLNENFRTSEKIYKPLLREIGKQFLTKKYYDFPKHGFSFPLSIWMRGKLKKKVEKSIGKKNLAKIDLINPKFYDDFVSKMFKGDNNNIQLIWNVFMLHEWMRVHA